MDERELKLECLKLAQAQRREGKDLLEWAQKLYEWIVSVMKSEQS